MTVNIAGTSTLATAREQSISITVLGDVQCRVNGRSAPGMTRTVKRLIAMLAGWPGTAVHRDRLVSAIWGKTVPSDAHNSLQGHVAALRRSVGRSWILTTEEGYALMTDPQSIDAERFMSLAEEGLQALWAGSGAAAQDPLVQARDLWRGVPFADVPDPELVARRERLAEVYERVREGVLECRLAAARTPLEASDVVPWAKEEVARSPLRERRHELLMRALIAADRPAEAMAAFHFAESYLQAHGGVQPGPGLLSAHRDALTARGVAPRSVDRLTRAGQS